MRPAVSHSGWLALVVCVGCWRNSEPVTPVANHLESGAPDLTGKYWCAIDESGYDYPKFPCMVRTVDGKLLLAKLSGSQRFTGVITPAGEGFKFVGKLYCPWGDCDQPLHGEFRRATRGELEGRFSDDAMVVRLVRAPADAFAGASYGGDSYGGDGYGDPWNPTSTKRNSLDRLGPRQ